MALFQTGSSLFKSFHPTAVNPLFVIPSTLNFQSRNAARKGYREKARLKQRLLKQQLKINEVPKSFSLKKTFNYVKTVELSKPDIPNDDIIIMENFKHMKFSISEAVKMHREFHHPTTFNNPEAFVYVDVEFDMTGKKSTQVIKPFSGVAPIPYPFVYKYKKEILVFCSNEYKQLALDAGASLAGGIDLIKKIQGGVIQECLYDHILCHVNFFPELTPIRGLLKNKLPRAKLGTLTADLDSSIKRFLHGVEYKCVKPGSSPEFGLVRAPFGTVDMNLEHLEANFKSLMADFMLHKRSVGRDFVTWVWCRSPPSTEKFSIDLSQYTESKHEDEDDVDDDDDEVLSPEKEEKMKIKQLQEEADKIESVAKI